MQAVVLVGGFGTRLRPLTLETPKQMLPVADRPMIEHVLHRLAGYGIDRAVLSLGYKPDAFADAYPDGHCAGVELVYAVDPVPLDTAGAIRFAAVEAGIDDTFLALNGDVLTTFDLDAQIEFHRSAGGVGTLHLIPVEDPSRFGVVPTDDSGKVEGFVEKPPRDQAPSRWINAGTYVLEPDVLDIIPAGRPVSIERETFPLLAEAGRLFGFQAEAYWVDAGTPESFLAATLDRLDGVWGGEPVSRGDEVRVDPSATVDHSFLGPGVGVGPGAVVRDSVLLEGVEVGESARIEGSIVGAAAHVGAGAAVLGLSVVGPHEHVEPARELDGARLPDAT